MNTPALRDGSFAGLKAQPRCYFVSVRYFLDETNPTKDEAGPDDDVVDCIDI